MNKLLSWRMNPPTNGCSCNKSGRCGMKDPLKCDDPRRLLIHANLYLWRQWRLYGLPAWQDAISILHRARHDVEEEDDALFLETLDVFLSNNTVDVTPIGQELVA